MLCLRLSLTVLVAFTCFVGCVQDTSICREEISTQKGRTFLVTFSTFENGKDFTGFIYIGSYSSGIVNITKHIGSSSTAEVRNISPGVNEIYISPSNLVQTSEGKQTKVLQIESTVDIAVYMAGGYSEETAAAYTVFPERAWSTKYVVPSFSTIMGQDYKNVVIMSSLKPGTMIQITNTTLMYTTNATIQAYESYTLVKSDDISGTVVQSNSSVSLVSGNQCAYVPEDVSFCDTLLDSPVPVEYWETEFIVPPLTPKLGYLVRVFAQESNETVNIMLKNKTQTINQTFTGMYEAMLGTDALIITSDRKINVVQYGLGNNYDHIYGDPFMTSVPAIRHYSNDYIIPNILDSYGLINTIAITIRRKHLSGLLLDGKPIDLQTAKTTALVQPFDEFRIISINLTSQNHNLSGNHNLSHPSSDATFSVLLYGRKEDNGLGLYLGYRFNKEVKICENGGLCTESTICQCLEGYTGDRCQSDINECLNAATCRNGGTCINTAGNFMCLCSDGWNGRHCENAIATIPASNSNLMCFACEDTDALSLCETIKQCQPNEICFLERFASIENHINYRSGCKDRQTCSLYNQTSVGLNGEVCLQCCEGSFCNYKGCGDKGFPPKKSRGPVCLDCAHVRDPNDCDQTTLCSSDEICYIEQLKWGDESLYHLGCRSSYQCAFEARSLTVGSRSGSVPMCQACCHDDFCNRNCTRQIHDNQQVVVG